MYGPSGTGRAKLGRSLFRRHANRPGRIGSRRWGDPVGTRERSADWRSRSLVFRPSRPVGTVQMGVRTVRNGTASVAKPYLSPGIPAGDTTWSEAGNALPVRAATRAERSPTWRARRSTPPTLRLSGSAIAGQSPGLERVGHSEASTRKSVTSKMKLVAPGKALGRRKAMS